MATLKLYSDNKDFSFIIRKNPASGMMAKSMRKGTVFGWYGKDDTYCIAFFDGMDVISFGKKQNQEFAFLDQTQYNAPLFLPNALREFFQTVMKNQDEKDVPGHKNVLEVSAIEIKRMPIFEKLVSCFHGFDVEFSPIPHEKDKAEQEGRYRYGTYSLKISTERTLHDLLNLGYLIGYLIAICSRVEFIAETNVIRKLLEESNSLNLPYYVSHLIKTGCIHSQKEYEKAKDLLNVSRENESFKFAVGTNSDERYFWVKERLPNETDILDFGCGEGKFFYLAKKMTSATYYAVDKDESARDLARKRVKRLGLENIVILESLEDFFQLETGNPFVVIASEVFEHNPLSDMDVVFRKFMENPDCRKILVTTPNKDFNKFYGLEENETRHEDHVNEMRKEDAVKWFSDLVKGTEFSSKSYNLGDEVNGIPSILAFSLERKGGDEK